MCRIWISGKHDPDAGPTAAEQVLESLRREIVHESSGAHQRQRLGRIHRHVGQDARCTMRERVDRGTEFTDGASKGPVGFAPKVSTVEDRERAPRRGSGTSGTSGN